MRRAWYRAPGLRSFGLAALIVASIAAGWSAAEDVSADLATGRDLHAVPYVGSAECRKCHSDHWESWGRTYHRTMTQEASERAVLGDFDDARLPYMGVTARMHRDDAGRFLITFEAEGGRGRRTVEVVRTVGSHRYQQYLAREGDSYVRLPVAWHVGEGRWFHMNGAFLTPDPAEPPPGEPVPEADYDRHVVRWNDNCVFCHNVAPDPGWNAREERFETEVAELGVACEACHGPGAAHVARNRNPLRRYALHLGDDPDPTIVSPARLSPERSAEVCGRCHGQRITDDIETFLTDGDPFVPGDDLALYSAPLWRDTPLDGREGVFEARFWPDGTARLTAYEYQGLLQSPCAQRGELTCTTCHGMHEGDPAGQIRPALEGDAMCTSCHAELAHAASLRQHSGHDPEGAGARCVACHMPRIVYGLVDVHPSHRIDSPEPDPDSAGALGRPNACVLCHVEGTDGASPSAAERMLLGGDPIERAVAARAFGDEAALPGERARARRLGWLLDVMAHDAYPAVRRIAWSSARALTGRELAAYDPMGRTAERRRAVADIAGALPYDVQGPPDDLAASLRAQAARVAIEIGE